MVALQADTLRGPVTLTGLGSGQGWNDGSFYTGYVTLNFNGTDYTGICVDALHDATPGATWDAIYVPLTDPSLSAVLTSYFPNTLPSMYVTLLKADIAGFLDMAGASQSTTITLQHEVWGQFDPAGYNGTALQAPAVTANITYGNFGLLVDANYAKGGSGMVQAFLIDPPNTVPEPVPALLIGIGLVLMGSLRRCR